MMGPLASHDFCPFYRAVRRVVGRGDMGKQMLERRTTRSASDGVSQRVLGPVWCTRCAAAHLSIKITCAGGMICCSVHVVPRGVGNEPPWYSPIKTAQYSRACLAAKSSLAAPAKSENAFSLVPVPGMGMSGARFGSGGTTVGRDRPAKSEKRL